MRIAVTGASGHIGYNLCEMLLAQGHEVRVLQHSKKSTLNENLEVINGSVTDQNDTDKLCRGIDAIFHLAAFISIDSLRHQSKLREVNVQGTQNIINSCLKNGVSKLIHFSSIDAFNPWPQSEKLDENRDLHSLIPFTYGASKAESQQLVLEANSPDLQTIVLCPTAVIGPEDHGPSLTGQMVQRYARNQIPALIPGGFNWVDVRDVVQGAIGALIKGRAGEAYILSGHYATNKQIAQLISENTESKIPRVTTPFWMAGLGVPFVRFQAWMTQNQPLYTQESLDIIKNCNPNISFDKAIQDLAYTVRPLEKTIFDTVNWFGLLPSS
ncbi:MAG: NAD-dependent epimerase/dehydratase family protein [Cyclobacteriaceae bacterium]